MFVDSKKIKGLWCVGICHEYRYLFKIHDRYVGWQIETYAIFNWYNCGAFDDTVSSGFIMVT